MDKQKLGLGKPETAPAQATDFQELSPLVRTAVDVTVSDINDQLMITSSTTVHIDPTFQAHRKRFPKELDELEYRRDALAFLHQLGGVEHFEVPGSSILPPDRWEKAKVQVNLARFRQIKYQLSKNNGSVKRDHQARSQK